VRGGAVASLLVAIALVGSAAGHWPRPEDVIERIGRAAAAGVVGARRDETVARLLVVRVGPSWATVPAAERTALAEEWRRDWRAAVPNGLLGIVDAERGAAVVNFDANGRARLVPASRPQAAPSMNSLKP
jgi:hypothetical protein